MAGVVGCRDKRSVRQTKIALRDAANDLADRVDTVADEVVAASQRLGKRVRRVGDALDEYSREAEREAFLFAASSRWVVLPHTERE